MIKEKGLIKIKAGEYKYKDYIIKNMGYYPPDSCIWWEAININTGCADYHENTLTSIINRIKEEDE